MDPTGPSQPEADTAYNTSGNPTDQTPQEESSSTANSGVNSGHLVDQREHGDIPVPSTNDGGATASSLGYGARDASGDQGESISQGASNVEGDQMRAPGEGDVYKAQFTKSGFGEQEDLAAGLDQKKAEQSQQRGEAKEQSREDVDVAGALGDRSGLNVVEGS